MLSLMAQYNEQVAQNAIVKDSAQIKVITVLQRALNRLHQQGWLSFFRNSQKGVFLWGKVGVGKSWLMNQFYQAAPIESKQRFHYHEFMEMIHHLKAEHENETNPLANIADDIARRYQLLWIDEIHVTEIGDAMLLYGVIDGLFNNKVMLIATSNYAPDDLYQRGFHREMFLPAIELLKKHNDVIEVEGSTDHRIQNCKNITTLEQLTKSISDAELGHIFNRLATGEQWDRKVIKVNKRPLSVIKVADGVVWLDFRVICSNPRATSDYIELSKVFSTVIVSNIDEKAVTSESMARRFLHFVDELYDHNINLVISALENLMQVYKNETLRFQFTRTVSRLYEMQGEMVRLGYIHNPDAGQLSAQ